MQSFKLPPLQNSCAGANTVAVTMRNASVASAQVARAQLVTMTRLTAADVAADVAVDIADDLERCNSMQRP
jgi:hypothetical protein